MRSSINMLFISLLLLGAGVFVFTFYSFFYNIKLLAYLRREKYSRWKELTSIGKFGPGLNNAFRTLPYIYSELDNEDEKIAKYKGSIRIGTRYFVLNFIALLTNIVLLYCFKN